jgi:transcriptional regulator with XRE-family HTH domain
MATEYGSRLKQARKHASLTQIELSKKTGVPQSTISTAEREGYGSGETPVYARACGVNGLWLGTGEGDMLASTDAVDADPAQINILPPTANKPVISFAAIELAAIFDMIPIEDRLLRAEAFSLATTAIAEVIRRSQAKHHGTAGSGTPAV